VKGIKLTTLLLVTVEGRREGLPVKDCKVSLMWALTILFMWFLVFPVHAGDSLPSTPLPLFEGGTLNLQGLKGNVVVIRFLASW
jgi:hypothetical protein